MSKVKIYFEDCRETLNRLDDGCVDLLLQDPPFGVTKNKWDVRPDLSEMWEHWRRVTKEDGAMLFFATQPFASDLVKSNEREFRYDLIWYKPLSSGYLNANRMPLRNHEILLMFYRKLPVYNPQMSVGRYRMKGRKGWREFKNSNYGEHYPSHSHGDRYYPESVLHFTNGDRTSESFHPTQKPLSLLEYLILTYSNEGDLVFDGYVGSGTTAHACVNLNRRFIGAECNKEYYDYAVKRVREASSVQRLRFK